MLKKILFSAANTTAFSGAVALLEKIDPERKNLLRILTYHRVEDVDANPTINPSVLSATPAEFDRQMAFLRASYNPVSVTDVLDYYENRTSLPPRSILVTFDDAYYDFDEHAWPVLQHYNIPVTLFVPTAYPDQPKRMLWWDQLYGAVQQTQQKVVETPVGVLSFDTGEAKSASYKQLRDYVKSLPHQAAMTWLQQLYETLDVPPPASNEILGWDRLRQLAEAGVTLGPHTQNHPLVNRVSLEEARAEAVGSREDLQQKLNTEVLPIFAYPSGGVSKAVVDVLDEAGFKLAFTTVRGINRLPEQNPLLLKRINVGRHTSLPLLRGQLLPSTIYLNKLAG